VPHAVHNAQTRSELGDAEVTWYVGADTIAGGRRWRVLNIFANTHGQFHAKVIGICGGRYSNRIVNSTVCYVRANTVTGGSCDLKLKLQESTSRSSVTNTVCHCSIRHRCELIIIAQNCIRADVTIIDVCASNWNSVMALQLRGSV